MQDRQGLNKGKGQNVFFCGTTGMEQRPHGGRSESEKLSTHDYKKRDQLGRGESMGGRAGRKPLQQKLGPDEDVGKRSQDLR